MYMYHYLVPWVGEYTDKKGDAIQLLYEYRFISLDLCNIMSDQNDGIITKMDNNISSKAEYYTV